MIGRYKPAQRFTPLRPQTLAQAIAARERAKERLKKRLEKRKLLGLAPDNKTLRARNDHLWSLAIRRRDRNVYAGLCLVCVVKRSLGIARYEPQPIEVAYHIEPRGNDLVRWRMDNGVGACARCNDGEKWSRSGGRRSVQEQYRRIHVTLVGEEKLKELEALARQKADYSHADLKEIGDGLKAIVEGKHA